jgi:hypothetical protein
MTGKGWPFNTGDHMGRFEHISKLDQNTCDVYTNKLHKYMQCDKIIKWYNYIVNKYKKIWHNYIVNKHKKMT